MITYEFLSSEVLRNEDVAALDGVLAQLGSHPAELTKERVLEVIQQARVLVARDEGGVIMGLASLHKMHLLTRTVGRIEGVVVDTALRGQGVGKGLIKRLVEEARRLGVSRLLLTSRPTRMEANHLYQKMGFEPYETNAYRLDL